MPFTGKVGDTLRLTDSGGGHRYVIISKPNAEGYVVVVNFTSRRSHTDWQVTFNPKDNKKLFRTKTTIEYALANLIPVANLIERASNNPGDYVFCHLHHIKEIVIGAFMSKYTPFEVLDELENQYPSEAKQYYIK